MGWSAGLLPWPQLLTQSPERQGNKIQGVYRKCIGDAKASLDPKNKSKNVKKTQDPLLLSQGNSSELNGLSADN
jgi:hypothetical protein